MTALNTLQIHDYIENIDFIVIHPMGESATAPISALPIRLAMLKKHQGLAIALFFSYAKQMGKTNLYAVQLRIQLNELTYLKAS
ncbi:MAG: hypothetical protein HOB14_00955 [Gammaproteobacteria bacterium]|nr:hypothetical protein [Gammaproteobacteria bacterium]MBT6700206.1 hypothetical protein [Gammaproteobacteria bacterium]MBT7044853.1 hypothetical protein [Gammaproteobacteria bacterium]